MNRFSIISFSIVRFVRRHTDACPWSLSDHLMSVCLLSALTGSGVHCPAVFDLVHPPPPGALWYNLVSYLWPWWPPEVPAELGSQMICRPSVTVMSPVLEIWKSVPCFDHPQFRQRWENEGKTWREGTHVAQANRPKPWTRRSHIWVTIIE
jgi:hypothetical protein